MKKLLTILALTILLFLCGCSSAPSKPSKPTKTYLIDNLVITYPDEEGYTARQDNEYMHSIFNSAKGINVSIDRYEMTENFDPIEELKSLISEEFIKEENGVTYGFPSDNTFLRFVNNDYYYYMLTGGIAGVEVTDELLEEVKGIVLSAAIDSSIPVEEPVKANDVFHFQSLQIETPAELSFSEGTGDFNYGIIAKDGSQMLFINYSDNKSLASAGYDLESIKAAVYDGRETKDLGNGFQYTEYTFTTESGKEYNALYSLMNDANGIYDVYITMLLADKEKVRDTAFSILQGIQVK